MARKLSDAEFTERTRAANRRRTERYQQRLAAAGKVAVTLWIPESTRTALTAKAANDGATIADTAAALLSAALTPSIPEPEQQRPDVGTFQTSDPDPEQLRDVAHFQMVDPSRQVRFDTNFQISIPEPVTTPVMTTAERDQQILDLHRQGVAGREIARRLGIGKSTVQGVVKRMEKA